MGKGKGQCGGVMFSVCGGGGGRQWGGRTNKRLGQMQVVVVGKWWWEGKRNKVCAGRQQQVGWQWGRGGGGKGRGTGNGLQMGNQLEVGVESITI